MNPLEITQQASSLVRGGNGSESGGRGLTIQPIFCPSELADPFDSVSWEGRTAAIKADDGQVLFEQQDCEVPATWSQLATNVVASKYFYGEIGTPRREKSVRQLIHRVVRTITDWGLADGYFASPADAERFYRELVWLCLHQYAAFNSPVWFNVGLYHQYGIKGAQCTWHWNAAKGQAEQPENPYEYPQASACFIQSVQDNMEDIMELARSEAMLFKFGSGTGTDLSTLRSFREKLSGGGRPSGPISFMRVYDQIAAVVKSGGKTRRAAKMQSLKVTHPDIMEFIQCKRQEERKARMLIEKGLSPEEAMNSVLFQNANLSVRVTDEFMRAVETDQMWTTRWVTDPSKEGPTYRARELLDAMAECAWECGDPGIQYDTTINRWHTCPNSGRINASNPCSEFMFIDDSACNLASVNLMKFRREDGSFDADRFAAACRIIFIAQEILVDRSSYPTKKIAENSHRFRPIGLGYTNLGSLLMASGLPYDSDQARGLCSVITAIMTGAAYRTSVELAAAKGPFEAFELNRDPMLHVMEMHWDAVQKIRTAPPELLAVARRIWDQVLLEGRRYGFRNAQATVLAPTGTISFMMDCDTTGIEPDIALVKYKQLAGGGVLKIVNNTVPLALRTLGYSEGQIQSIVEYVHREGTIEGAPELKSEHLPVFDCAFQPAKGGRSIHWRAHILMMAAAQPFISGAISKTVNLPKDATPQDIRDAYMEAWRLGLKALAVYRDGSKNMQVLVVKKEQKEKEEAPKPLPGPRRERLPDTRRSITHKFSVAGHEGYITVGMYPDGRPGELFITMAKEGSTIGGLMDCFGTAVSMSLQYGVPLEVYVNKFTNTRFEPMGFTSNPEIRYAKSIVDYIFRWLGLMFLPGYREAQRAAEQLGLPAGEPAVAQPAVAEPSPASPGVSVPAWQFWPPSANSPDGAWVRPEQSSAVRSGKPESAALPASLAPTSSAVPNPRSPSDGSPTASVSPTEAAKGPGPAYARLQDVVLFQDDAPPCDHCGAITWRSGNCYVCRNCGHSMGCS
ncbi:MAG: vitamin B12-dependent ribonucleotide reductase [Thermoguttaceae bacterium]|nr:vitamin B12-dependent ribonucleotide reductase [Thermoguttaceae bacterium]MDW8037628.1 vitamin B12-dependent ribonucleotide reductase [Thermoguttaceae bacterium]